MKKQLVAFIATLGLAVLSSEIVANPVTNGGFESGNSGGFFSVGNVDVVAGFDGYAATEGSYFAALDSSGSGGCGIVGGTNCSFMATSVEIKAGNTFSFDWAFLSGERAPYNDFAVFLGLDDIQNLADTTSVANFDGSPGDSGWQTFTWTAGEDMSLIAIWASVNNGSQTGSSALLVDNIHVVPEPASLALLGLGLLGMRLVKRK